VVTEILEADLLNKREYPPGLFDEAKAKKTSVNPSDLVMYVNRSLNEFIKLPFGREEVLGAAYKCHKYLQTALPAYTAKIRFVFEEALVPQELGAPVCDAGKV
jgi:hypothetical protein